MNQADSDTPGRYSPSRYRTPDGAPADIVIFTIASIERTTGKKEEFTLSELYQVIRAVVPEFEEPNFIRKITSTQSRKGLIEEVRDAEGRPKRSNRYSQRAAQLYRFTDYVPRLSIYS